MPITMTSGRVLWVVNRRRGKVLESVMLRGFQVRRWDPLMETAEEAKTPTNIDEAGARCCVTPAESDQFYWSAL